MSYFFPNTISHTKHFEHLPPYAFYSVNSGEAALRILIKSQNFKKGSRIAIPAFVCGSVARAVIDEGHLPIYFDLKNENAFITDYSLEKLTNEKPSALILVHLYGVLHDDNKTLEDFCIKNNIFLIQDLAQSYGLDEKLLNPFFPILYSFGPGKSATAAGGAMIKWVQNEHLLPSLPLSSFISSIKARLFLKSRIFGHKKTFVEIFMEKFIDKYFSHTPVISQMSQFQKKAACYVMLLHEKISNDRQLRWKALDSVLAHHEFLKSAMNNNYSCLAFKYVINAQANVAAFKKHLEKNQVPYYCLGIDIINDVNADVPIFKSSAINFIEISCESVIPLSEIERVAILIRDFKP
jgi:dTDP-4-amino-4,6-dideoxygalactose transaminase